jgi:hypothetical protein
MTPLLAAWQERRRERKFQIAVENRAKKLERRGLLPSAQERTEGGSKGGGERLGEEGEEGEEVEEGEEDEEGEDGGGGEDGEDRGGGGSVEEYRPVDSSSLEESESDAPRGFFRRRSATVYASAAAGRADDARRGRGEATEVAGGWDQLGGGDGADEERRRDPGDVPRWAVEEQRKREVSMRPGGPSVPVGLHGASGVADAERSARGGAGRRRLQRQRSRRRKRRRAARSSRRGSSGAGQPLLLPRARRQRVRRAA